MLIDHKREKLLNAIVYFLKNTKHCGKTKIFKLLYFLDFLHFKETAQSVTGLRYSAWDNGPAPADLFQELKCPEEDFEKCIFVPKDTGSGEFFGMKPKQRFDDTHFSERQLRLLEELAFIFKEVQADDIVEVSHLPNQPWDKTIKTKGLGAEIDYFLAIDDTDRSLSLEEVKERVQEIQEIESLLR
jgi:uncharacterized phage-associated protein